MALVIIALVISLCALLVGVFSITQISAFKRRMGRALGETDQGTLEELLRSHHVRVEEVNTRLDELDEEYKRLDITNSLASQKISIVRFNPFGDTGGDQSFSLAVLDAHDSGYVLTSIHGRQGTRVYVKPIDFGKSKYSLSAEEQQALTQAAQRVPKIQD